MGGFVAETYFSAESAPTSQDARLPNEDEDQRRPPSPGGAPQERTPSPHAHLDPLGARDWDFRARCVWCAGRSLKAFTGPGADGQASSFPFSIVRTASRTAGSESV